MTDVRVHCADCRKRGDRDHVEVFRRIRSGDYVAVGNLGDQTFLIDDKPWGLREANETHDGLLPQPDADAQRRVRHTVRCPRCGDQVQVRDERLQLALQRLSMAKATDISLGALRMVLSN